MLELFTTSLVTLMVIVDPPGCAPIFASLTAGTDAAHRRNMAIRASIIAFVLLLFFGLAGQALLDTLGISLAAFRMAGGIMLFMIALDMVFEKRTERREKRAGEILETPEAEDISVFPMAIPMMAGPGAIASMMLMIGRAQDWAERGAVIGAAAVTIFVTFLALLAAGPLMRLIGAKVEAMITRVLGVILAALAAQFVVDGLKQSFPALLGG